MRKIIARAFGVLAALAALAGEAAANHLNLIVGTNQTVSIDDVLGQGKKCADLTVWKGGPAEVLTFLVSDDTRSATLTPVAPGNATLLANCQGLQANWTITVTQ